MIRTVSGAASLALAFVIPAQQAAAQEGLIGGAIFGGATGAIIGGAVGGRGGAATGAIIGAATGATLGAQMERRRSGYYWYNGRCWRRDPGGNYHLVSRGSCG
jgi:outer membrane lipoprotein SlyB